MFSKANSFVSPEPQQEQKSEQKVVNLFDE
jgi:hypothetical protein